MNIKTRHIKAQAMVEFALALPLLMLLIVGLIEVGHLIFMYSSVYTASREGSRYGAAAGKNDVGDPLFQDCLGIRNAVKKAGILLNLEDEDIVIEYDGPSVAGVLYCDRFDGPDTDVRVGKYDRVIVTINAQYSPMIPLFVPLSSKIISSTSARTITGIISINKP